MEKVINLGMVAHVDAGKTTTTEQMLYRCGRLRQPGSVDEGTAQTDWLPVERERGISVSLATTVLERDGVRINLIDTPGHADFVGEVERVLSILDGAVLILSAAEGIQAQTELLWKALASLNIPVLLYLNKVDRAGCDQQRIDSLIREPGDRLFHPDSPPHRCGPPREAVTAANPFSGAFQPRGGRGSGRPAGGGRRGNCRGLPARGDRQADR